MSYTQSKNEEFWNFITHAAGIVIHFISFIILLNVFDKKVIDTIYVLIYGISLLLLFSASSIYHKVSEPKYKKQLRKLDHISIYILIAGTYTPICMSVLQLSKGLFIFILVWSIATVGLVLKLFYTGKFEKFSLFLYLLMGWLIVLDYNTLINTISEIALTYLILGGFFYTSGVIFYVMHKLKYHHVIWHIFVLLGSIFHFMMVYEIIT